MDKRIKSLIKSQAYIDGEWVGTADTPVLNKATGELIAQVPDLGVNETREAINAAQKAFRSWSKRLAKERSNILRRWYDLIIGHADDLALILSMEQGKPLKEAKGEIIYGASFVEFYAEQAKRIYGETIPTHKPGARTIVIKQPVGVVAAITPWNFPHAMITRKVTPALAAGCTTVVKPAEETPLSALALAALAEQAGIPPGVFNIVTAAIPEEVGKELTSNPAIRLVTFTGSTEVGRLLMAQSASTVKKVGLELGGNAPFIVFADADLDAATNGIMESKFRNAGQTCVCANRIYVHDEIYDELTKRIAETASKLKVGEGIQSGVEVGPLINESALKKVQSHVNDAKTKGAKILTGGGRHKLGGNFFEPTVVTNVTSDMKLSREETFGPVAPFIRFSTEEEVIALANDTEYGLAAYFYARDVGRVWRVAEALEYGMVGVNEGILGSEVTPFGGHKQSGLGVEGSHHGIEEFVEMKYILVGGL